MIRPYEREFFVPTPTRTTRFFRTFFPWQLARFFWINLKMIRMIRKGRHGRVPLRPIVDLGRGDAADAASDGDAARLDSRQG